MGQSSSSHAAPTRRSHRPNLSMKPKYAGPYTYSDDGMKGTHDAANLRQQVNTYQPEAQSIGSSSRRLETTSSNAIPMRRCKEQPARHLTRSASQQTPTTLNRRSYYDEPESTHLRDDKAAWSLNSRTGSELSLTVSIRPIPRQRKECVICTDNRSLSHFPPYPPTAQCSHNADVCRRCLRTWISITFASKVWEELDCPVCSERLAYRDVNEFAPPEVFRKYKKLSTKAALEATQGFHWCLTRGCKSGQVIQSGSNQLCCVKCKKTYCVVHNMPWHKRETCKDYEYRTNNKLRKEEEKASKKWLKEKAKICPGCRRPIEKINGCDHMTCSKCRHEFCWDCLAPYKKPRDMASVTHRTNCIHHNPRIPRAYGADWDEGWGYGR